MTSRVGIGLGSDRQLQGIVMSVTFRTLRACDRVETPWKNGGGVTSEVAIWPIGATLDAFDWRISMAKVSSDGPFSLFPGIDRTLVVLEGAGMRLSVDGGTRVQLDANSRPQSFAGDVPVYAERVEGAIVDFNVMTRRGRFLHDLEVLDVVGKSRVSFAVDTGVVLCRGRSVSVVSQDIREQLGDNDALLIVATTPPITLELDASAPTRVFVVSLRDVSR